MVASVPISETFKSEFSFVDRWLNFFSLKQFFYKLVLSLYQWSVRRLLTDFQGAFLIIKGAQSVVENYDKATAKRELKFVEVALNKFIKFESLLSNAEYLRNPDLKQLINSCISGLYYLEFILRKKGFEGDAIKTTDSEFKQALSDQSKSAILTSLAN